MPDLKMIKKKKDWIQQYVKYRHRKDWKNMQGLIVTICYRWIFILSFSTTFLQIISTLRETHPARFHIKKIVWPQHQEFWKPDPSCVTTTVGTQVIGRRGASLSLPQQARRGVWRRGQCCCVCLLIYLLIYLLGGGCYGTLSQFKALKQPGFTLPGFSKGIIFQDDQLLWIGVTFPADGHLYLSTAAN